MEKFNFDDIPPIMIPLANFDSEESDEDLASQLDSDTLNLYLSD